jgi:hypothetical protein
MATAKQCMNAAEARRFAALLAGFDTGNNSDEEAGGKGRAMRRMAADCNARIVDLLETPEVRRAVDDQLQPVRQEGPELQEAREEAAALRAELTERTRDVRKLAEALAGNEFVKAKTGVRAHGNMHSFGAQSWVFEVVTVLLALIVMGMAVLK